MKNRDLEGRYNSTYHFVTSNKLGTEATELFGLDWEAEDDVDQVQQLIEYLGESDYLVSLIPYVDEDDILVSYDEKGVEITKLKQEVEKYKAGFNELMTYFDSISDEEKPKVIKFLTDLGL